MSVMFQRAAAHGAAIAAAARRVPALPVLLALLAAVVAVVADPYPPYWGGGSGAAVHYAPVAWPADASWIAYTRDAADIADKRANDGSNGGTSPQGYVNVSSGCTDQTAPSVYYAFNAGAQVLYFRWRVQAPPTTTPPARAPGRMPPAIRGAPRSGRSSSTRMAMASGTSPCISTGAAAALRPRSIGWPRSTRPR